MSRLRILHLTDLHLRDALPGTADRSERLSRRMPAALDRLAGQLRRWSPDAIALTGDLLDVPDEVVDGRRAASDPDGHAEAVRQATADYRWMRDWLAATNVAAIVIPGNHDHRGAFAAVFGTTTPAAELGGWRLVGFDDELDARRAPLRPAAGVARFTGLLDDAEDGPPQVHLQHYMLAPRVFRRSAYTHHGTAALARRIAASGRVRCVLAGHYHPGALTEDRAGIVHCTTPAFCEAPFRFRLVDLDEHRPAAVRDLSLD